MRRPPPGAPGRVTGARGRVRRRAPRPAVRRAAPGRRSRCSPRRRRSTASVPRPAFDYATSRSMACLHGPARRSSGGRPRGENLFRSRPGRSRPRSRTPTVDDAPSTSGCRDARGPSRSAAVLIWQVGARRYLADRKAVSLRAPARTRSRRSDLAGHRRPRRRPPAVVGARRSTLDAATRLASLVPADVGSAAGAAARTDENGFVVEPTEGLVGIFGFYTRACDDRAHPGPGPPSAQPARSVASSSSTGSSSARDRRDVSRRGPAREPPSPKPEHGP
jgi:hypothetical protein